MSCQVHVRQGILEGKVCQSHFGQTYYSFEGIPYAKPPVGKLRFRAPQEPESWTGVKDATKPGNKCAQVNPYRNMSFEGSEDCLYLNVYTPKLPAAELDKLPVLFFVHGGRLLFGYGDYYRPDYLIRHSVILVTINYRLHILGLLCLDTPDVPGNAALKDTVMALKWVKENIHKFNGDPNNIVAFGESAGAAIVTSYMCSAMADGMVDKIISHSGNPLSDLFMVEEDSLAKARHVVQIMGKKLLDAPSISEYLTDVPIDELLPAVVEAELSRPPAIINCYFPPVVEKEFDGVQRFFEENPHVSFNNNRFKKLPIIVTMTSHEGALFLRTDENGDVLFEDNFKYFIPRYLAIENESPRADKFVEALEEHYFNKKKLTQNDKSAYVDFVSDVYFARDILMFVEIVSKCTEMYMCMFSFGGELNTSTMKRLRVKGASHGDLLQYLFFRENKNERCGEKEREVVDVLSEAWCNFARSGKPSWKLQKQDWLPYTTQKKYCLNVDDEVKLIPHPYFDRLKIWFDLMKEKSKF